jgi:integrase/recombinase XerC
VQLLLQTGLRVGEVENLKLENLFLYDRSGEIRVRDGKGRKERSVPLNSSVRKALKDYLLERRKKALEKKLLESFFVFVNSKEVPLKKRALQKTISQIMNKAGISSASAHTLRHTFATAHYNDHKKLVELSNLLGHSSLNTTARYTQASKEQLAKQLEESSLNEFGE